MVHSTWQQCSSNGESRLQLSRLRCSSNTGRESASAWQQGALKGPAAPFQGTGPSDTSRSFAFWHVLGVHHQSAYGAASQVVHGFLRCATCACHSCVGSQTMDCRQIHWMRIPVGLCRLSNQTSTGLALEPRLSGDLGNNGALIEHVGVMQDAETTQ